MTKDRLQWFPCYPEKLLGALIKMEPHVGYVYVIILLRIYEVGGPINDTPYAISRRSGVSVSKVKAAISELLEAGKLITSDGLMSNPEAENVLDESRSIKSARKNAASTAAKGRWRNASKNKETTMPDAYTTQCVADASTMPQNAQLQIQEQKEEKEKTSKKEKQEKRSRADRATRIPDDWKLTPEMGNYGRSRGLTTAEVKLEAEKFIRYWRGKGGEKGRKLDWKSTWENWCISTAERLGRKPRNPDGSVQEPAGPENFDRKSWETIALMYSATNNWNRAWGPEPGPKCKMPADLQAKIVNHELTDA